MFVVITFSAKAQQENVFMERMPFEESNSLENQVIFNDNYTQERMPFQQDNSLRSRFYARPPEGGHALGVPVKDDIMAIIFLSILCPIYKIYRVRKQK